MTTTTSEAYTANVDMDWADRTFKKAKRTIKRRARFFSDDLTAIMGDDTPSDLRHTGTVVSRLVREGLIEPTGNFQKVAAGTHYRPVYRSTQYGV